MLLEKIAAYVRSLITMLALMAAATGAQAQEMQLHAAARNGDVAGLRALLDKGAKIDARNAAGATALLVATHGNQVEAARVLIEAGADVNAKDGIQDSPYLYAGARGHNEILKMTLAHGADLKSTNRYGGTALIPAAERGLVETVRILIDAGVDVNHVNNLQWTALLEAIVLGNGGPRHTEVVRLLAAARADVNIPDGQGVTPLQHARRRGFREMESILAGAGAR